MKCLVMLRTILLSSIVLASSNQLLIIMKIPFSFVQNKLNREVKGTDITPPVRVPWSLPD
jgi:hypothetical protein